MSPMGSQITGVTIVYSTVWLGGDKKKTSKLQVTGFCEGNSPVTGEFPAQRASNAENVSPFDDVVMMLLHPVVRNTVLMSYEWVHILIGWLIMIL